MGPLAVASIGMMSVLMFSCIAFAGAIAAADSLGRRRHLRPLFVNSEGRELQGTAAQASMSRFSVTSIGG